MSSSSDKLIFYLAVVLFVCFVFCFVFLMARHFSKGEYCSEKVGSGGAYMKTGGERLAVVVPSLQGGTV